MKQMIFSTNQSLPTTLFSCVVKDLVVLTERAELLVVLDRYNFQGEIIQADAQFHVNLIGTSNGRNYSLGEAFGSCLSDLGEIRADGRQVFDLSKLVDQHCIAFVHQKRLKSGQVVNVLRDVYPLELLQSKQVAGRRKNDVYEDTIDG